MKVGVTELASQYAKDHNVTQKEARTEIENVLDLLRKNLENGNDINIRSHFNLSVGERAARKGINPATQEVMDIPATKVVKFKASKDWKMAVNALT